MDSNNGMYRLVYAQLTEFFWAVEKLEDKEFYAKQLKTAIDTMLERHRKYEAEKI